jgi:hypothetical protein
MEDGNNPLTRMRSLRTAPQPATAKHEQARRVAQEYAHEETSLQHEKRVVVNLENNPVAAIMGDTEKSTEQKIEALSAYLITKDEDYKTARQHFAEFEAYFAHAQSQSMDLSEERIQKLINEVRENVILKIEAIVRDLASVQHDAEELDKMLDALEQATAEGKSVGELQAAVLLNDKIISEIKAIEQTLAKLDKDKVSGEQEVRDALDEKIASHQGFWNSVKRAFGEDKSIIARIEVAQNRLASVVREIELQQKTSEQKKTERNEKLEGPLTVLRTLDATENGFSERIAQTGEHDLGLIRAAKFSIENLLLQLSQSKLASAEMAKSVTAATIRNSILRGAVQKAEVESDKQSVAIKVRLDAKADEIKALGDDSQNVVQKQIMEADHAVIKELFSEAYRYREEMEHALATFATVTTKNTNSEAAVQRYADFLYNLERMIKRLQNEALPQAAEDLHMSLETDRALKLAGAGRSVGQSVAAAENLARRNIVRLGRTTGILREEEIADLDALTESTLAAQNILLDASEATVAHGIKRGEGVRKALEAAEVLKSMIEEAVVLSADAANIGKPNGPTEPDSGPVRVVGAGESSTAKRAPALALV